MFSLTAGDFISLCCDDAFCNISLWDIDKAKEIIHGSVQFVKEWAENNGLDLNYLWVGSWDNTECGICLNVYYNF